MRYVLFLKGVNVGGKSAVPMVELREALESVGIIEIVTILNSGNICFTAQDSIPQLKKAIERLLKERFKREITFFLRTKAQIDELMDANPFLSVTEIPDTRFYITFVDEPVSELSSPAPKQLLYLSLEPANTVASAINLQLGFQTTELMTYLEKVLGKNITTRNWQTILKIAQAL